ncbi:MAG TPA: hypothetical protein DCW43_02645 [Clostridiales bacterium]|nr:hypothetical protein [Clostridiales bacterium]
MKSLKKIVTLLTTLSILLVSLILVISISACSHKNKGAKTSDDIQSMTDSQWTDNTDDTMQKTSSTLHAAILSSACSGDIPSTNSVNEYSYWTYDQCNMHPRENAPQTCSIVFEGKEYSGEYQYSLLDYFNTYESDIYTFEGGDFAVKADTTEVVRIRLFHDEYGDYSIEECKKRAMEIASKYISVEDYQLAVDDSRPSETTDSAGLYAFHFRRYIQNTPTCAGLDLIYSSDGELVWFERFMVDEFNAYMDKNSADAIADIGVLESSDASDLVYKTIKQQYPESVSSKVLGKSIVILPDNQLGEVFNVEFSFETPDNKNGILNNTSQTIVVLYAS